MKPEIKERIEQIKRGQVPEGYKKTKVGIVPNEWEEKMIGECLKKIINPVNVKENEVYTQIGIRSHGKGIFYKEPIIGKELGKKSVFWIEPNCFILNIVFAWEQAIGKTTEAEIGMIASHRFPMYQLTDKLNIDYIIYYFLTNHGKNILESASPGGAGRNKTLGQDRFLKSKIIVPNINEQQKIADILSTQDKIIELKEKLIDEKQKQKKYLMQMLLTGKKRLKGFDGEWKKVKLGDIFEYIQPTPYIVQSANYSENYDIPVLTAGKSFILGYTNEKFGVFREFPVVIFDDFTTSSQYVDFPFKIKSSAIKILKCKEGNNTLFSFTMLQSIRYTVGGHERHWISKFANILVTVPSIEEQIAIANILSTQDKEIELLQQDLEQEKQKKKILMQLLLTGIVRV